MCVNNIIACLICSEIFKLNNYDSIELSKLRLKFNNFSPNETIAKAIEILPFDAPTAHPKACLVGESFFINFYDLITKDPLKRVTMFGKWHTQTQCATVIKLDTVISMDHLIHYHSSYLSHAQEASKLI